MSGLQRGSPQLSRHGFLGTVATITTGNGFPACIVVGAGVTPRREFIEAVRFSFTDAVSVPVFTGFGACLKD